MGLSRERLCYLKFLSKLWNRMRVAHGSIYEVGDELHSRDREEHVWGLELPLSLARCQQFSWTD